MKLRWNCRQAWKLAALAVGLAPCAAAQAAGGDAGQLTAELRHHYRLATVGLGPDGAAGIAPGQILNVLQEGIVGFADSEQEMEEICPTEYRDGTLHANKSALCSIGTGHSRKAFQVSDAVCITSLSASPGNDSVSLYLIDCAGGKKAVVSHPYSAMLVMKFPKGFVRGANAAGIEESIGKVLSSDETGQPAHASANGAPAASEPANAAPADVAPVAPESPASVPAATSTTPAATTPAAAAPEPPEQTVPPLDPLPPPAAADASMPDASMPDASMPDAHADSPNAAPDAQGNSTSSAGGVAEGQTQEQVKAILGAPLRVADLGAKVMYFYPQLKVVFVNGKVTEVQKLASKDS